MRSQIRARAQTAERRQKLQIGGGVLLVAVIWTLALWPSGDQQPASQVVRPSGTGYTPWTTGPFVGTTPTTSESRVPTARESTTPTVRQVAPAPAPTRRPAVTSTTRAGTQAPAPTSSTSSPPTKKGNGNGKPPKPTGSPSPAGGIDLFDIFGI